MPTGTGKTFLFSSLVGEYCERGRDSRALIIAHRDELLDQARCEVQQMLPFLAVGVEGGYSRASTASDVVCAGVATIGRAGSKRLDWFDPAIGIVDECHHVAADSYQNALDRFGFFGEGKFLLGVTATNHRLDNKRLHGKDGTFQEVAFEYSLREAIRDGWLAQIRGYRVKGGADLSGIKTTAGDYNQQQLAQAVDTETRNGAAIKHWFEVARNRRTIAFCASVAQAETVALMFREQGVSAAAIDGKLDVDERRTRVEAFKRGEIQVLTNVMVLTEGFNAPETDCILMLRPTTSWSLYCQMVGRGTRTVVPGLNSYADERTRKAAIEGSSKPDCLVIDVVDNSGRHALATVPSLLGLPADMDLQGKSLEEAARKLDEIGDRASIFTARPPRTFSEIDTLLERVDLLATAEVPNEVRVFSKFDWLKIPNGYFLDCGDRRVAHLRFSALGDWILTAESEGGSKEKNISLPFEQAIGVADRALEFLWPEMVKLADSRAAWKDFPPTYPQLHLLRHLGINTNQLPHLTKGEASKLITTLQNAARGGNS